MNIFYKKRKEYTEAVSMSSENIEEIFSWRQDSVIRKASFHDEMVSFDVFLQNFRADYFSIGDLPPFFLCTDENKRVGFARFRPIRVESTPSFIRQAEISLMVHPNERKKGYGKQTLFYAEQYAKEKMIHTLYAYVLPENLASKNLFEKAGYSCLGQKEKFYYEYGCKKTKKALFFEKKLFLAPPFSKVFLIAEIGSNWHVGSVDEQKKLAVRMIQEAAKAGVDAVKFQTFRSKTTYASNAGSVSFMKKTDINTLFSDLEMRYEDLSFFHSVAREEGVHFMSTPFSEKDFDAVDPYVSYHKVASYELCYTPLLRKVAQSKKPVFISCGASTMEEVSYALSVLRKEESGPIILMQCTAAYPAPSEAMNLSAVPVLRQSFGVDVGLSDHSFDPTTAPIMAVALGVCAIEKHVTADRQLPGPDQAFALDLKELPSYVQKIRLAEAMYGTSEKTVFGEEEGLYRFAKRRLQAITPIFPGDVLVENTNCALLRPGQNLSGAHPIEAERLFGKTCSIKKNPGEGIFPSDCL